MPRTPKPRMGPFPETQVMWAAGFFEGEGGIGTRYCTVAQVNIWPLERLHKTFGGSISKPTRQLDGKEQPIYQWAICGQQGRDFVDAIYAHLSPRRQAQIDAKFLTWYKFKNLRRQRTAKEQAHLKRCMENRDLITGRYRSFGYSSS